MKKILGIVVLMMVMTVSALAVSDSATVPVYLNVPEFVRLSVDENDDGEFNLVFDPADPESTVEDTVALLAEANVSYTVSSIVNLVRGYADWANLINVTIDKSVTGFGLPGEVSFNATAYINVIDHLNLGTVPADTHIADVVFTISSI
ncbi:MAG TPA: hypothetical protein PKZ30_03515 [Defluviitoga tunisiensis]|nr:hypothetical protein [Defluviitoga tunisiensis]